MAVINEDDIILNNVLFVGPIKWKRQFSKKVAVYFKAIKLEKDLH